MAFFQESFEYLNSIEFINHIDLFDIYLLLKYRIRSYCFINQHYDKHFRSLFYRFIYLHNNQYYNGIVNGKS